MKTAYDVIIRPIITEQSMEDLDIKKYAFEVAKDANKIEIKKAMSAARSNARAPTPRAGPPPGRRPLSS